MHISNLSQGKCQKVRHLNYFIAHDQANSQTDLNKIFDNIRYLLSVFPSFYLEMELIRVAVLLVVLAAGNYEFLNNLRK